MRANPEIVPFGSGHIITKIDGITVDNTMLMGSDVGIYGYKRDYQGSVTPEYRQLRKTHRPLPFNAYSCNTVRDNGSPYINRYWVEARDPETGSKHTVHETEVTYTNTCFYAPLTPLDDSPVSEAVRKAEVRLRDKVGGMSANLAQAFGERRQTAMLIAKSVERILSVARAARHGDLLDVALQLGYPVKERVRKGRIYGYDKRRLINPGDRFNIANALLEYEYGLKPLMQDVYGSIELLNKRITSDGLSVSSSANGYYSEEFSNTTPKYSLKKSTRCRLAFHVRCQDEMVALAASTGITNPALLTWELIPLSFVVDWFIPVGEFLEGLTAYDGFSFQNGSMSTTTNGTYFGNYQVSSDSDLEHLRISGIRHQTRSSYVRQAVARPFPIPPSFRSPIGGEPLERFAIAMALLKTTLRIR